VSVPDDAVVRPGARVDEALARVLGDRTAAPLAKLGLRTTGDLLRHYPRRYTEPGTFTNLTDLAVGEHVTVQAEVRQVTVREMRSRGGAMLQAVVTDGVRTLQLTFFAKRRGVLRVHEQRLVPGRTGLFTGVVSDYRGQRQLTHPDYQLIGVDADDEAAALVEASRPIPLYPASAAVPTWRIQRCVRTVLDPLTDVDLPDPIPAEVRSARGLVGLRQALTDVHEPFTDDEWRRGRDRLRYEEAFVLQAELARRRQLAAGSPAVARPRVVGGLLDAFDARVPFTLTDGQRAVGAELEVELAAAHPMQRLLQGEVGSGKTVVALRAMLQVVDARGQAALLAPTEVLAAQHVRTLRALLGDLAEGGFLGGDDLSTRVALLTGSQGASARRENLLDAASGRAGIVVGTHALLSETVQFADLGLVVVDEQHRFGVEQRDTLRAKATQTPHLLVMTATPIPRTVAMTVFGDLETSTLSEIPAGRSGVTTVVVPADNATWVARTWERVREEVEKGGRAYVVCPRIDPDDEQPGSRRRSASSRGAVDDDGADLLSWDDTTTSADEPSIDEPSIDEPITDAGAPPRRPLRAVLEVADDLARAARSRRDRDRDAARAHGGRREGPGARGLHVRPRARPGVDHGDRGRRGRHGRDRDGRARCRPVRHLPAAPAAGPRRAWCRTRAVPPRRRRARRQPGRSAAHHAGCDHRRVRARRRRPRPAPRGRRPGRRAVGWGELAAPAAGGSGRCGHRAGQSRRARGRRARSGPACAPGAARRDRPLARR
jgi:ATP-dependent DNA helicase RecG